MGITVAEDLAVAIGDQSAKLSPGEAFRLAEKLIRTATVRMVTQEVEMSEPLAAKQRHHGGGQC